MEDRVIALVDRLPKSFAMARHLDHLVWLLRVVDVPAFDKLRDTIQIGETRSRFLRCTVKHLVDSRFGQACARPPGVLQNEGPGSALAKFLGIDLKHHNPHEGPAANKASRLPEGQSLRDVCRPTNFDPKLRKLLPAAEGVQGYDGLVEPQVVCVQGPVRVDERCE